MMNDYNRNISPERIAGRGMERNESALIYSFVSKVYAWMTLALILTGITAYYVASVPSLREMILGSRFALIGIFLLQLALIFVINTAVKKASFGVVLSLFVLFAFSFGLTLSSIFMVYAKQDIASAFFVTAGAFGALSIFGLVTKRDLTGLGNFMFVGLVGIVLASIVNWFVKSPSITWVVTYLGVVIFAGLTAYDTQKLKSMAVNAENEEMSNKLTVSGALSLYLDFINMFLFILRIMNRK